MNYLEKAKRIDVSYITHRYARFVSAPKKEHGNAIRLIQMYLKATKNHDIQPSSETEKLVATGSNGFTIRFPWFQL